MARKIPLLALALTPVVLAARYLFHADGTLVFVLACVALIPLAWLIGEATENVSEHTGPGIGGFLNASFGNAPELIIALFAIGNGLPDVVRGSITGSVVSSSLLVLGFAMITGGDGDVDRRSLSLQLGLLVLAVLLFLVPSVPGWHGDPDRHSLYLLTLPVAAVLLVAYLATTTYNLRRHAATHVGMASEHAWTLRTGIVILAAATVATALVSEVLVGSLDAFGHALGLSQFFIAVVIVAIVGNAAEHGGAVVVARRGNTSLAAEIAISSPSQIAVFVASIAALCSGLIGRGLPLAFRPVELATMGIAAVVVAITIANGRSKRSEGYLLVGIYALAVVWYGFAGDR
ncbi:MAG TPA: calcium/proton exchanger [Gaiellaceae bacterium]|nr:calcium/proton exchanger [Gaiellaceae bacterium]